MKYGNNLIKRNSNLFTGYEGTPICNFNANGSSASQITITVGDTLNFYDTSTKIPTSWSWNFGNATPSTSTVQNPTGITFGTTGFTTIYLSVTNKFGSNVKTKTNYINVQPVVLNKLAISTSAAPLGGLGVVTYYSGFTWSPSGMSQRNWTWNMLASDVLSSIPTSACTMTLKYTDGNLSNYIVRMTTPYFSSNYNNGKITGNNTGIYPDLVLMYSYVNYSSPKVKQMIRLSNLNINLTYKLTFLGCRDNAGSATSQYTITGGTNKDGTSVSLESSMNVMNTVNITGIYPSSSGIIDIGVDWTTGSANGIGIINAIEIDEGG